MANLHIPLLLAEEAGVRKRAPLGLSFLFSKQEIMQHTYMCWGVIKLNEVKYVLVLISQHRVRYSISVKVFFLSLLF